MCEWTGYVYSMGFMFASHSKAKLGCKHKQYINKLLKDSRSSSRKLVVASKAAVRLHAI